MVLKLLRPKLYIFSFLHQTTTVFPFDVAEILLYIFSFLHQTTTVLNCGKLTFGCISLVFYIKPQLFSDNSTSNTVVYL